MKVVVVVGNCVIGLVLSSCSTTQFQTPDYYDTKLVTKSYPIGKKMAVNELRCSENYNKCDQKNGQNWKTHRKYNQPYYFKETLNN